MHIEAGGHSWCDSHKAESDFGKCRGIRLRVEAFRGARTEHEGRLEQVVVQFKGWDGERSFTDVQDSDAGNDDRHGCQVWPRDCR